MKSLKGVLDDKYNKNILKYFSEDILNRYSKDTEDVLKVALMLQYIKIKTIHQNKKLTIHVHPKTDLDQRLSIFYICSFLNIKKEDLNIVEWSSLKVEHTNEFDVVVDIEVSESFNHKNILIFDHHNGESHNTLEQLRHTISPTIPINLVEFVDSKHMPKYNVFEPQHASFLKDYDEEKVIHIFKNKLEYNLIDVFKEKDLYKKWKERKRKNIKTLKTLDVFTHKSKYGKVCLSYGNTHNMSVLSLNYSDCDFFINIKSHRMNRQTFVIMSNNKIPNEIISKLKILFEDLFIYPDETMVLYGSTYSNQKYIQTTKESLSDILQLIFKFEEIKYENICYGR